MKAEKNHTKNVSQKVFADDEVNLQKKKKHQKQLKNNKYILLYIHFYRFRFIKNSTRFP